MKLYHGVDLVAIERIQRAGERWGLRFLRRVFTAGEQADCGCGDASSYAPRWSSLAARWAAKEATAKALGIGLSGLGAGDANFKRPSLRDIEVQRGPDGRPTLLLHGPAAAQAARLGVQSWELSLSHEQSLAIASVIGYHA